MNIWRKFESEQAFMDWHEQSKQLLGMPIVGVRASDGVPQPDKQQTTDYTALTYRDLEVDSDGEPIIPVEPPFPVGYVVTRNGNLYESLIDANVWEPGVFGWELETN